MGSFRYIHQTLYVTAFLNLSYFLTQCRRCSRKDFISVFGYIYLWGFFQVFYRGESHRLTVSISCFFLHRFADPSYYSMSARNILCSPLEENNTECDQYRIYSITGLSYSGLRPHRPVKKKMKDKRPRKQAPH